MSSSLSAASSIPLLLLHASCFVVLTTLLLAASAAAATASLNTTTNGGSSAVASPDDYAAQASNFEMYYCFLCTGRHPLMIHYCPIYWDECHLECWDETSSSSTAAAAAIIPDDDAPVPVPVQGKECYVMKVYQSGRYVIVQRRTCDGVGMCFLSCGGGELADRRNVAGAATTVPPATRTTAAATMQTRFVPFELCNTELVVNAAPRGPPSGGAIVVPAAAGGGARRRRS